ncbi:MAG: IS3 family transposase [Acidimicrobiales bacterium]
MDRIYMEHPSMGSRQITATLCRSGIQVNRKRVQRLLGAGRRSFRNDS